jgi:hypothetical protein
MISATPFEKAQVNRRTSVQMGAVLRIFNVDHALMTAVKPHIDFENESILWDEIFALPLDSRQRAAAVWAYSIWTDKPRGRINSFDIAFSMDRPLQIAVLEALALRWGLLP